MIGICISIIASTFFVSTTFFLVAGKIAGIWKYKIDVELQHQRWLSEKGKLL